MFYTCITIRRFLCVNGHLQKSPSDSLLLNGMQMEELRNTADNATKIIVDHWLITRQLSVNFIVVMTQLVSACWFSNKLFDDRRRRTNISSQRDLRKHVLILIDFYWFRYWSMKGITNRVLTLIIASQIIGNQCRLFKFIDNLFSFCGAINDDLPRRYHQWSVASPECLLFQKDRLEPSMIFNVFRTSSNDQLRHVFIHSLYQCINLTARQYW